MVITCIDGDAVEPGAELRLSPKPVKGPVRFQEDLLANIFGVVAISRHIVGDPEHFYLVSIHNLAKGINTPLSGPFNENLVDERRFHWTM